MEKVLCLEVDLTRSAAQILRAINHSLRHQMIVLLHKQKQATVTDLFQQLELKQSEASQHLSILRKAGVVTTRRVGRQVFYSIHYGRLAMIGKAIDQIV